MENIRKKQKQEGITLIALVVTIVVLLILAGTSIAMLTGDNGIITNAQKSQMENTKSEVIEKMNMAYNAAYSEARIKMATDAGYQPSAHIAELAGIVAKELEVTEETTDVPTEGINNGYHVYYKADGTTITMLYGDRKFSLKAGEESQNNLYPNVKGEITLSTSQITYTKQPNSTTNSGNGGNTPTTPETPNPGPSTPTDRTGINVGDYIDYSPDATAQTTYSKDKLAESITGDDSNTSDITRDTTLKWQVLKINTDGSMDIIGTPTSQDIYFRGALGYNNGVYVMNDICKTLYSRSGIEARSVNVEDFEYWLKQAGKESLRDDYGKSSGTQYNTPKTYESNKKYPYLYQYEIGAGINSDTVGSGTLGLSKTYTNENGYTNGLTTNTFGTTENLTVTQTYWNASITEANFGEGAKVLSNGTGYWLASRYASCSSSYAAFGLRYAYSGLSGHVMFYSFGSADGSGYRLRSVVSLKSSVQIEASSTASSSTGTAHHITQY